ncbi:hypothetical protein GYH30_034784 [Glycine max]|uniref:Transmembrane protein n=1 Tax=Glycine max TaxID=3847 RepID=A0A0R0H9Q9_SOYBN|nr:hypothetical protein GYH30_034784 [Glycine max]
MNSHQMQRERREGTSKWSSEPPCLQLHIKLKGALAKPNKSSLCIHLSIFSCFSFLLAPSLAIMFLISSPKSKNNAEHKA